MKGAAWSARAHPRELGHFRAMLSPQSWAVEQSAQCGAHPCEDAIAACPAVWDVLEAPRKGQAHSPCPGTFLV